MKKMKPFFSYFNGFIRILSVLILSLFLNSISQGTTIVVTVQSFNFAPANISVNVGDTVKWQWVNGSHTTSCDGTIPGTSLPPGAASWNANMTSGSPTYTYVVRFAGTYHYVCIPHSPDMAGVINASAGSTSLLTENFDYPAGDSLGAHGWNWISSNINPLMVTSPGLVYTGYPLSNIGNATSLANTGEDMFKNFTDSVSSGSLYISFMVNVSAAQAAGDYFMALLPAFSTTLYTGRFYARDSSGLRFGISKTTAAAGGIFYSSGTYNLSTTYLVVIKCTFNPGTTDDVFNVYIFDSGIPSTEPVTPTIGPVTGTATEYALGRIALRQGTAANAPTEKVDGIKASRSWSEIVTKINTVSTSVTDNFELSQNYPNPFNPNTTIKFTLPESGFVNLTVYNSLGKEVKSLVNENINSGSYSVDFNGSGLNSGVYFYKMSFVNKEGNNFTETKRLILLK